MKKRIKITLRTKIYLTIAALLALTGVFYASNPTPFSGQVPFPTGVAAGPDLLLVSEYCSENIDSLDCNGNASVFAVLPGFGSCREKYMTIAPSEAANAGFQPRDIFVSEGPNIFKIDANTHVLTLFTTLGGCAAGDHNGLTFDHFGTFGFDLIVTCRTGGVYRIHSDTSGSAAPIATVNNGGEIETPAVVPPAFGPNGGQIWVADEDTNAIHAVQNTNPPGPGPYTVHLNILSHVSAEGVYVIPQVPCTFTPSNPPCNAGQGNGAFFLAEQQQFQLVWKYPQTDFNMLGGNVILTSESGADFADTSLITASGGAYVQSSFGPRVGGINEGSSFVDCDVPTATPTTTPTATFTPTPTFTPTATFTPTPTATFTPTPTATFTPTPTATFTPTPTPTPTGSCNPLSSCTPPYPFVCPAGHPCPSSSPARTNVAFNESTVLKCFRTTVVGGCNPTQIQLFYNDEHALTLGVRQINNNGIITNYPVSPLTMDPDSAFNPATGATEAQGGVDTSFRPMFPAIFVTDLSVAPGNANELAGDWQYGGTGQTPNFVSGTWKAAVRTVTGSTVTVTPDMDPPTNDWNLGPGADPVCSPTPQNEGYGAEVRWDISQLHDDHNMPLQPGHMYRLYFMVHDGDQNKTGGDSGQGCSYITIPSGGATPTPTPTATPTPVGAITVTNKVFSLKTVQITFQNGTTSAQVLNALQMTWPQATNGNLTKVTMGATTIYNKSTGGGNFISFSLSGTPAQRTIAVGGSATLTFTFQNNVNTTAANYTGTATFSPFGPVNYLP